MKNFKLKVILAAVLAVAITVVVTIFWAERDFRKNADTQLTHMAQIKTLEFQSSLNEQLTLVRQMVRSPLVKDYLKNPDDPEAARMGKIELLAYQNSYLSKSIFWVSDKDHKFWSDMQYAYTLDPNDPDTYWYKMTMYETQEYNFNINYNPDLNKTMLWVNAVVRNEKGTPIGIAGTGIPLTDFINSMYEGIPKDVEMYLYNDVLEITGATDQSILKDHVSVKQRMPDLAKFDALPVEIATRSAPKAEYVIGPLKLIDWYMVMKCDYTPMAFLTAAVTPIAICLVAVILIFVFFYTSNVAISAKTLKGAVDELSSGNADLTQRVKLKSDSALKVMNELVASLNRFIEKLQGIVGSVKNSNEALVNTGTALRDCTQNTVASINEIIGNIESMGKMIEDQTQSVSQASSAVEEMIGNINSVNASVEKLSGSFAVLQKGATEGVAKQEEVNKMVLDVQQQSEMLKTANSVISGIARQTNLLAMNAAIEAAHAGEAGKGFSVVADEIRKLSENSSAQTKTIGAQLKTIQESVDQIVSASKSSQDALKAVSDSIAETDALVHEISGAMGEQLEGSAQINEALSVLNNNSSQVKQSSEEMTQGSQAILREVEMLENATGDIKSGMDEMRTGASLISNVSDQLKNLAGEMQNAIDSIGKELGQFRV